MFIANTKVTVFSDVLLSGSFPSQALRHSRGESRLLTVPGTISWPSLVLDFMDSIKMDEKKKSQGTNLTYRCKQIYPFATAVYQIT